MVYSALNDIGWARIQLEKAQHALSLLSNLSEDNVLTAQIVSDYIMEADAKFLYGAEKALDKARQDIEAGKELLQ